MRHLILVLLSFGLVGVLAAACQSTGPSKSVALSTLNESGVTGKVTLTDLGGNRTRVEVVVDPAGNLDMPAHIHPGSCAKLVPQPKYPLENVRSGKSVTDVPASISELTAGALAVNLHKSINDLKTYTACADLH